MKLLFHKNSQLYKTFDNCSKSAKIVMFSGLPGVGKSLYIHQFHQIAQQNERKITVIQWDMARKAFETPEILARYPLGDGLTHKGVLVAVGLWVMDVVKNWLEMHPNSEDLLLVEAPLLGNRFIELVKIAPDASLENILKSEKFQVIVPIPSKKLRHAIEKARAKDLSDTATTWTGAKPSVMLLLWKMVCIIANQLGKNIDLSGQPPYDPAIYQFVFEKVLQHRHFTPLHIDKIYTIEVGSEDELHNLGSLKATADAANQYVKTVNEKYPTDADLERVVNNWFRT
jgi:hypothetical protein